MAMQFSRAVHRATLVERRYAPQAQRPGGRVGIEQPCRLGAAHVGGRTRSCRITRISSPLGMKNSRASAAAPALVRASRSSEAARVAKPPVGRPCIGDAGVLDRVADGALAALLIDAFADRRAVGGEVDRRAGRDVAQLFEHDDAVRQGMKRAHLVAARVEHAALVEPRHLAFAQEQVAARDGGARAAAQASASTGSGRCRYSRYRPASPRRPGRRRRRRGGRSAWPRTPRFA